MYYANAAEMKIDAERYLRDLEARAITRDAIGAKDFAEAADMFCYAEDFLMEGPAADDFNPRRARP